MSYYNAENDFMQKKYTRGSQKTLRSGESKDIYVTGNQKTLMKREIKKLYVTGDKKALHDGEEYAMMGRLI